MPRRYSLGKRAALVAETRARIVDAAVACYQEQGISRTSMHDVARRADVAPGTVLNHFESPDELARAAIEHLTRELRYPTREMFDGLATVTERVARLAGELTAFYERAEPWYQIYIRDEGRGDVWSDAEAQYVADVEQLIREALGPLGTDASAVAVVTTVLDPSVISGLRSRGLSPAAAGDVLVELLTPWLASRSPA